MAIRSPAFLHYYREKLPLVSHFDLLSKEWNDLVFEHRNKCYGAYQIRKDTGRRYRRVAYIFIAIFLALFVVAALVGFFIYRKVEDISAELSQEVRQLRPISARKGFEVKRVSAGRRALHMVTTPGGRNVAPDIVDRRTITAPIGIDGPSDNTYIERSDLEDKDPTHNAGQNDLPVEGAQLVKTETVEAMPQFPGGLQALMKFMDENVIYLGTMQRSGVEGDAEVSFIVQPNGEVTDIVLTKKINPALDRVIITAVKRMPKWKPGRKGNVPIPSQISIPIHFQLQ